VGDFDGKAVCSEGIGTFGDGVKVLPDFGGGFAGGADALVTTGGAVFGLPAADGSADLFEEFDVSGPGGGAVFGIALLIPGPEGIGTFWARLAGVDFTGAVVGDLLGPCGEGTFPAGILVASSCCF